MSSPTATLRLPAGLTNPGVFFACCGLFEILSQNSSGALAWFEDGGDFCAYEPAAQSLDLVCKHVRDNPPANMMTEAERQRREALGALPKQEREANAALKQEKKDLDALWRESPVTFGGEQGLIIDWFADESSGGSRFKTWAGQQSVLDIATAMHQGFCALPIIEPRDLWLSVTDIGLPFNFDSDLGAQGSPLDIGFSTDPLAANKATRLRTTSRPALELLAFIGLQRFRPRQGDRGGVFEFTAWSEPMPAPIAAMIANGTLGVAQGPTYSFRLLYRTDYLKSFLPATPSRLP